MRPLRERIAKIAFAGEPDLVFSRGLSAGDLRKAMRIVSIEQDRLMEKWKELHG